MTSRIPSGFEKLRHSIVGSAAAMLEQQAPEHVRAFRETIEREGIERASDVLSGINAGSQFRRWRRLCLDLMDVELQVHRVKNSLELMKSPACPPLNQGEWVEYHYDAWAILMQGLLYRVEKLAKDIVRELVRPTNTRWKLIETELLQKVTDFQSRVKVIRHPIAHTGGAVDAITEGHLLELYILLGGRFNMKDILEPMGGFKYKWHYRLSSFSARIFTEIDALSEHLHKEVEW